MSAVYIKFDDETIGKKQMNSDNFAKRHKVVPISRVEASINIHTKKTFSPAVKRIQFPLILAWACTVHKVQGKQFTELAIRANPKATNEYELLRKDYVVEPIEDCDLLADSTLTVTLLNTRC